MLWLRALTILAALMTLPYFLMQENTLYLALIWQTLFAIINLVNVIHLLSIGAAFNALLTATLANKLDRNKQELLLR